MRGFDSKSTEVYYSDLSKTESLTMEQEHALAARIKKGDKKAADKLICANLKFATRVAKQYLPTGLSFDDLCSVANWGLTDAAYSYDEDRGKFISYAVWHIRKRILIEIAKMSRLYSIPVHINNACYRCRKVIKAERINECDEKLVEILVDLTGLTPGIVKSALTIDTEIVRFDKSYNDEENAHLIENFADNTETFEKPGIPNCIDVDKLLEPLNKRDVYMIKRYFGLDGEEPYTLEDIGINLGISRERVRQLKDKIIAKMKKRLMTMERMEAMA